MDTFWSESWKTVDPKRIAEYVKSMDMAPDEMIRMLRQHQAKTDEQAVDMQIKRPDLNDPDGVDLNTEKRKRNGCIIVHLCLLLG